MGNKIKEYKFSIVVPCFNEAGAVAKTVKDIFATLKEWQKLERFHTR